MAPTTSVSPSGAMASNTPTTGSNPVDSTTPVPDGLAGEGTKEMDATDERLKSEDIVKKLRESEDIGMCRFCFPLYCVAQSSQFLLPFQLLSPASLLYPKDSPLYPLPLDIKVKKLRGKESPIRAFFPWLEIEVEVPAPGRKNRVLFSTCSIKRTVHMPFLRKLAANPNTNLVVDWIKALGSITNTGNATNTLEKCVGYDVEARKYFAEKVSDFVSTMNPTFILILYFKTAAQETTKSKTKGKTTSRDSDVNAGLSKMKEEKDKELQAKLLLLNNLPHQILHTPEFKELMQLYNPKWNPIARETFVKLAKKMFNRMTKEIKELFHDCKANMHGEAFLSILHDMWTSLNKDGVLGSCVKFVDSDFNVYHVATLFELQNSNHGAEKMAEVLKQKYKDVYNIVVKDDVVYITSDTCPAARNVAQELEGLQDDCEMHVLSLILAYASGQKENVSSSWVTEGDGKRRKVTAIVTDGGEFEKAAQVIKQAKAVAQVSYLLFWVYYSGINSKPILTYSSRSIGLNRHRGWRN